MAVARSNGEQQLSKAYTQLVDIVFAVVVGQSIVGFSSVLYPPTVSLEFGAVVGILVVVVFSWAGYHMSVAKYPYTEDNRSLARLGADFVIVLVYVYLIETVGTIQDTGDVGEFIVGFGLIFAAYLLSGVTRIWEYEDEASRWKMLVISGVCYLPVYISYRVAMEWWPGESELWGWLGIVLSVGIYVCWRFRREIGGAYGNSSS